MYFNHLFDISLWDAEADYVIFDDFGWDFIPAKKCFLGGQKEFTLTDKYRKKKTVRFGKPCIVLTNDTPRMSEWEEVNCYVVALIKALF